MGTSDDSESVLAIGRLPRERHGNVCSRGPWFGHKEIDRFRAWLAAGPVLVVGGFDTCCGRMFRLVHMSLLLGCSHSQHRIVC